MTIVVGLDSAEPPSAAQAAAMHAAGVRLYGGYLPMAGAYHGWTDADFAAATSVGEVIAYAFPAADPRAARADADRLGALLVCDNARGDTADPFAASLAAWMAAAGNPGMYGQPDVLTHWRGHYCAAVAATRPGADPRTNDPNLGLGVPTGNQWEGSHDEYGLGVDRGWYPEGFTVTGRTAPTPAPVPRPVPPTPPTPSDVVVRPGDSLSGIAQRTGYTLGALEAANPQLRRSPHEWGLVYAGDVVHLPGRGPVPAPAPHPAGVPVVYTVRRGDTLGGIAFAYHRPLAALETANRQLQRGAHNYGLIFPGDVVHIP